MPQDEIKNKKMLADVPYNLESEQAVLGSILIDNKLIIEVSDELAPSDFYDRRNQYIFQAMTNLFRNDIQIDFTTLLGELETTGSLNDAGGAMYLSSLIDSVYTTTYISDYVQIVSDASLKRKVIAASKSISEAGYDPNYNSKDYIDYAERIIMDLSKKRKAEDLVPVASVVDTVNKRMIANRNSNSDITGLSTGFPKLDAVSLGLQKQSLIILAARPAMGKSAFAMNLAINACKKNVREDGEKISVAIFSLEMPQEQIVQRMLASLAKVNLNGIQRGSLNQKEMNFVGMANDELKELNLFFSDQGTLTIADIRAKCRKQKMQTGLDLVVIDYLQLINSSSGKNNNRQEEVSQISRSLKQMARELDVPVIALAQLSREVEKREDKRPMMADLRESGSIEQDADIVMFLYRGDYYKDKEAIPNTAELIIAKNRNGVSSGDDANIKFIFQGEYQLFTPYQGE